MVKIMKFLMFLMLFSMPSFAVEIVAFANEKIITDYDITVRRALLKIISPQRMQGQNKISQEKIALIDLINDVARMNLASKSNALASPNSIKEIYENMSKKNRSIRKFKYDKQFIKDYLRVQRSWGRVIQGRIASSAKLEEGELKKYYETLKKTPMIPSVFRLSQIIIEETERVNLVYSEVKNIKSCGVFNKKASLYGSVGSGDMGRIPSKSLALPLQHIFSGATVGKVLEPMPIGNGAIIFMLCSKKQKNLLKDEQMKKRIEYGLLNQKVEILGEQFLQNYRDQMYIEIKKEKYEDVKEVLW